MSNRENWGGLSQSKFTVSGVSSSAVQLNNNISEIWSPIYIYFFRGKIVIIQVFDEDIIFFSHSNDNKEHALAKTSWQNCHNISPMKKTVNDLSCSGFNTIALFSRRIFKIVNVWVNGSLILWFCFAEKIFSVTWNSPIGDYQIFDWGANLLI